jgi:hypothetical protein
MYRRAAAAQPKPGGLRHGDFVAVHRLYQGDGAAASRLFISTENKGKAMVKVSHRSLNRCINNL